MTCYFRTTICLLALGMMLTAVACAPSSETETESELRSGTASSATNDPGAESTVSGDLPPTGSASGASLILITLDTTRADRIGAYGYRRAETPNLDRLAANGIRFENAVSPVPMTLPAHASLMTAQRPPTHGVRANGEFSLDPEAATLAEHLADNGYRTAAFVSAFVLDSRYGLAQGFEVYDGQFGKVGEASVGLQIERSAEQVTTSAVGWLRQQTAGEPFFLWLHYFDAHDPYEPPEPWASRFSGDPYDGEIAAVDHQIGRLLRELEGLGLSDEALVAVTADHGESLGEHHEQYHGKTLYEGAVRVPLIVSGPGISSPRVETGIASLIDIAPTVLDLLGLDPLAGAEGVSFLRGDRQAERSVYLETLATYLDNGWAPLYGARSQSGKYIQAPRPEFYDLTKDPNESTNLLEAPGGNENDPRAARLSGFVERLLESAPSAEEVVATSRDPDPEALARLQALGYMTGGGPAAGDGPLPDPKDVLPLYSNLAEAREAIARRQFDAAERLARELLQASPRDRRAMQVLGEAYAMTGREDQAERVLRRLIDIRPTPQALALLAQIAFQTGRPDEADALLDQGEALDPGHGATWIARGDIALFSGRPAEALRLYREAIDRDPFRVGPIAQARVRQIEAQRIARP